MAYPSDNESFLVGEWIVEPKFNRIRRDGIERAIVPKVMKLLTVLASRQGEPVSQNTLITLIWPEQSVSDSSLYQAVAQLRKSLGDDASNPSYIERISGGGYCLIAEVVRVDSSMINHSGSSIKKIKLALYSFAFMMIALLAYYLSSNQWAINSHSDSVAVESHAEINQRLQVNLLDSITLVDLQKSDKDLPNSIFALNDVLLSQLAHIDGLRVVHLTTSEFDFTTQAVLKGKIERQNDKVRVFLQIENVADNEIIWAKYFEGGLSNLFVLQDQIAKELPLVFEKNRIGDTLEIASKSNESFRQYLQARNFWSNRDLDSLLQAKKIYEKMQQKKTLFPLAAVGLCDTYQYLSIYSDWEIEQSLSLCEPLLNKALEQQPNLGEAHAAKGLLMTSRGKTILAQEYFELAIKNAPNYPFSYLWFGNLARELGNYSQALELTTQAYELAPMSPIINRSLAYSYLNLRQLKEARHFYLRSAELDSNYHNKAVAELDFFELNIERAGNFLNWVDGNQKILSRNPNYQLTETQVKLSLGLISDVEKQLIELDNELVNPSFLLYMKASLASEKNDSKQAADLLHERLLLHQNNERFILPYIIALFEDRQFEKALKTINKYMPQIRKKNVEINFNNQYVLGIYVELLSKLDRVNEANELLNRLEQWFNYNQIGNSLWFANWQLFRGDKEKTGIIIIKMMEQGWLPDFNSDVFPTVNMRRLFVESGVGVEKFHQLLEINRNRVLNRIK